MKLTEEEKKAISIVENIKFKKYKIYIAKEMKDEIRFYQTEEERKAIDIVLNLIEKLQKERDIYYYEWKTLEADLINKDYIPKDKIRENSWTKGELEDFYINSVDNTKNPIWTEEHIEELISDFYIIPKELLEEE